jgi:hypothetical protein
MATELVVDGLVVDREIKDAVCRMKRNVSNLPPGMASFFYDLCRAEPRVKHPMGRYPEAAFTVASLGAPWGDVIAPMNHLRAALWNTHFATSLPCFMEGNAREENANGLVNHCQHRALKSPQPDHLDALVEALDVQIAESQLLRAIAHSMRLSHRGGSQ